MTKTPHIIKNIATSASPALKHPSPININTSEKTANRSICRLNTFISSLGFFLFFDTSSPSLSAYYSIFFAGCKVANNIILCFLYEEREADSLPYEKIRRNTAVRANHSKSCRGGYYPPDVAKVHIRTYGYCQNRQIKLAFPSREGGGECAMFAKQT